MTTHEETTERNPLELAQRALTRMFDLEAQLVACRDVVRAHAAFPLAIWENQFICPVCGSRDYDRSGPSRDVRHAPGCTVPRARLLVQRWEEQQKAKKEGAPNAEPHIRR